MRFTQVCGRKSQFRHCLTLLVNQGRGDGRTAPPPASSRHKYRVHCSIAVLCVGATVCRYCMIVYWLARGQGLEEQLLLVSDSSVIPLFCQSKSIQKQAKASKSKHKQAQASKSKQKQAKASKSKQKQAKASKSKQKRAKASKSEQKQAKVNIRKQSRAKKSKQPSRLRPPTPPPPTSTFPSHPNPPLPLPVTIFILSCVFGNS